MAHNISFSDEEYQKAAEKWRQQLLLLPMLSCKDSLRFMTGIPGIRNKEHVGTAKSNAQFGPYKADKNSSSTTEVKYRELETFFGNVCEDFEPNSVVTMLLGQNASFLGEGQKTAPSAKLVIASVLKSLGESLHNVLFTAKRNAEGDTSADLFNGFITIADAEVEAGNIADGKGNLFKITTGFSEADALRVKEIEQTMLPSPSSGKPTRFSGLPRNSSTVRPNLPMPTTMPICSRMAVSCTTRNSSRRSSRGRTTRRRWRRSLVSQVLRSSSWLRNRICSMDMTACLTKKEFKSIVSSLLC